MLCILAMFTPALFMVGAAKAMFLPLSLAVGFSMVASYLLSSTLVPILSVWVLRGHEQSRGRQQRGRRRVCQVSASICRAWCAAWCAGAGWWWLPISSSQRESSCFWGAALARRSFRRVEAGQLQVRLRAPAGTQLDGTEAVALRALDLIKQEAGPQNVQITLGFIGVHGASYPINLIYLWNGGPEEGVVQVQLKPRARRIRIEALKERLRRKFAEQMPDVSFSFEPSDIVSRVMSLGSPTPIEVAVSGLNLAASRAFAETIKDRLQRLPALRDVQFGQSLDYPTVDVTVDRQKAGLLGVKMADVSRSLATGHLVEPVRRPQLLGRPEQRRVLPGPGAGPASADELARGGAERAGRQSRRARASCCATSPRSPRAPPSASTERYNMQRMVTVTANIAGADLGSVARQVMAAVKELGQPPAGVNVAVRGQVVPLEQMLDGLRAGLLLAVVVIFLLLAANFQSLKLSALVVLTAPAVIAGVVIMLWLTGTTLNIQSFMGAIMAIGVAVANAILLVTFAERARVGQASRLPFSRTRGGRRDACPTFGGRRRRGGGAQPPAPDPHDQPGDDRRHGADGAGPGRGRRTDRSAGPRGHRRIGPGHSGDSAGLAGGLRARPRTRPSALGLPAPR